MDLRDGEVDLHLVYALPFCFGWTNKLLLESRIQKTIVQLIRMKYPKLIFTCAPAVAKSPKQGHENKLMGYQRGWPDLFFALPKKGYSGLFIEVKTPDGKVEAHQKEILQQLNDDGYKAIVCRSVDEALVSLDAYLK